jgi:anti-sigma regulatory factor (Ser/Thr protein kinase)
MLSSGGSIGEIVSFLKEGVHDVLQKPLDSDALARAVSRAVSAARDQERAELSYRFIASEGSKYVLTSRELADIRLTLPILDRLYLARMLDLSTKLKLELAFQEMLANALEHGNLALESGWKEVLDETGIDQFSLVKRQRLADDQYADKSVAVQIELAGSVLSISVEDEGAGFIPDVPDAWRDGVDIPHGRGLQLMFSAADDVKFEKIDASGRGTRVTIRKRVTR